MGGRGAVMCAAAREAVPWLCSWACGDVANCGCKGGGDMAMQLEGGGNVAVKV
jgi:hypothetical protein